MSGIKVPVLVGSLRAASINRQLAELAIESAANGSRAGFVLAPVPLTAHEPMDPSWATGTVRSAGRSI
jgi:NAD(P)H-dependent FMN reductase